MAQVDDRLLEQQDGEKLLTLITGTIRALELYDLNNDTVRRLLDQITEIVASQAGRGQRNMILQIEGENFFVNQTLLRLELKAFQRLGRLRQLLQRLDLNEIEFREGANPTSLTLFFERLTTATGHPESIALLSDAPRMNAFGTPSCMARRLTCESGV